MKTIETTPELRAIDIAKHNWHWVYAHGSLVDTLYDDRLSSDVGLASLPDGIHNFQRKERPICLYLWTAGNKRRGLAVFMSDAPAMRYAREKFEEKAINL